MLAFYIVGSNPGSEHMANKTRPTNIDPLDFIANVDTSAVRRRDALTLLQMMQDVTAQPPRMWGPSIIGFGEYHYKYASGREGDAAAVGFSPRKAKLVVYGLSYPPAAALLLGKLGTFTSSVACIYITRLADVDMAVLRELVGMAYRHFTTQQIQSVQSQRE